MAYMRDYFALAQRSKCKCFFLLGLLIIIKLLSGYLLEKDNAAVRGIVSGGSKSSLECQFCQVLEDGGSGEYDCIPMQLEYSPLICLYDDAMDNVISQQIRRSGYWEKYYTKAINSSLVRKGPKMGFIDVGANIGVHTVVVASMGHDVISVEPNIENAWRMRTAVERNGLQERVTILRNAVANERGIAKVIFFRENQGLTTVHLVNSTRKYLTKHMLDLYDEERNKGNLPDAMVYTNSIYLDDVTHYCQFTEAVMKVDIEGFEHLAFQKASVLFNRIRIHKVFMEWTHMRQHLKQGDPEDRRLILEMIQFFVSRGYRPGNWRDEELDTDDLKNWPGNMIWSLT